MSERGELIASQSWRYDAGGRPEKRFRSPGATAFTPPSYTATYHPDNRMNTVTPGGGSSATVVSDLDGNMKSVPLWEPSRAWAATVPSWDARNRLIGISTANATASYAYDAEGNLISRTQGGQTIRYTVDPGRAMSQQLIEHRPDGSKTFYVYGPGLLYEESFNAAGTSVATRSYHYDQVGSTVALSDAAGAVTGRLEYTAYGVMSFTSGIVDTKFRYNGVAGVQTDLGTGLLQMRARWYSPSLGRFLSEDPIGFSGGMNWFAYADGNPINLSDPFGLDAWTATMGGLRMVGGAFEVAAGYSLAGASAAFGVGTGWTGVGLVAGGAGFVGGVAIGGHGIDTFQAGMRQMWSGQNVDSVTSTALQSAGMSQKAANLTDAGIGVVGSFGAGFAATGFRASTLSLTAAPEVAGASLLTKIKYYEVGQTSFKSTIFQSKYEHITNTLDRGKKIFEDFGSLAGVAKAGSKTLGWSEGTLRYLPTPMGNGALGSIGSGASYLGRK